MKKLIEIQNKLKCPKSQYNSFGKYNYRNCEDILEAVKPLCSAAGLLLTLDDEIVCVGNRLYVKATATLKDGETSLSVSAYAREAESKKGMDEAQITGACSSYARKYALNGLFLIDDTKDADSPNPGLEEISKINKTQINKILDMIASTNSDMDKFLRYMDLEKLEDMIQPNFGKAIVALEAKANEDN
jgi:hypothetical protein